MIKELTTTELKLNTEIKQYELSENKTTELSSMFNPMMDMLEPMEDDYNQIIKEVQENGIDKEISKRARTLRLSISKVRTKTEKMSTEQKRDEKKESNRLCKAIDGLTSWVTYASSSKEEKLKKIENHLENIEKERVELLIKEREDMISQFVNDEEIKGLNLDILSDELFDLLLESKKNAFEKSLAEENVRIEAEIQAKKDAELEATRIREENAKLKADAEKAENERLALEEKEAIAKLESEAKQKAIEEEKAKVERKAEREKLAKMKAIKETEEATKRAEESEKRRIESEAKAKQDLIDAEDRRIAEVTAMAESSDEITLEEIERAKAEGKAVFVKVIRIESDCKESGIFITGDK